MTASSKVTSTVNSLSDVAYETLEDTWVITPLTTWAQFLLAAQAYPSKACSSEKGAW